MKASAIRKTAYLFILLISLTIPERMFGQHEKEILGRIYDLSTREPVPYATIRFENSFRGIVSNLEGGFRIPERLKRNYQNIIITCIGYEEKVVDLNSFEFGTIKKVYLKQKTEVLDEVVVSSKIKRKKKYVSPYSLVKKAIAKIPENSPNSSYTMIGYYRDYHNVDEKYFNVNEAIVKTFDAGYQTDLILNENNRDALLYFKTNTSFQIDSALTRTYDGHSKFIENTDLSGQGGNELGILKIHDPIRNYKYKSFSFIDVLKKDFLNNHEFTYVKSTNYGEQKLKEVGFIANYSISGSEHEAKGEIYISENNYEIFKFHYQVNEKKNNVLLYEVTADYQLVDDKMFLKYITYNNKFKAYDDDFFDITKFEYDPNEVCFYVSFNSPLKRNTVHRKNFKLLYGEDRVLVDRIKIMDSSTIKLTLVAFTIPKSWRMNNPELKYLTYKVKNISDINNRRIFKAPLIKGYQFREFFVQEINSKESHNSGILFINKNELLSNAQINSSQNIDKYWVNTMFKKIEN